MSDGLNESIPVTKSALFTTYEELQPKKMDDEQNLQINALGNLVGREDWEELEKRIYGMIEEVKNFNLEGNETNDQIALKVLSGRLVEAFLRKVIEIPYGARRATDAAKRNAS